ncbi:uncharacterized protein LOC118752549 [Rhagoletis pomonella]|uniref:uncharacterized protein LOC118752549 n=1 Tax=Rhagoletis pomonella TaxID=28610 RepID=UPI0017872A1E|nr:uncharacterized protein LOC118752549 [Rhagoletis pomonella]
MTSLIFGAFPDAVSTIINKHYVDDLVASFNEAEEAVRICQEIFRINRHAGFELRNFISNYREVEEIMNQQPTSPEREADSMFHRVPQGVLNRTRAPTKRKLLRIVMAEFDPFETSESEIEWDNILPMELGRKWLQWWQEINSMKQFTIPRCSSQHVANMGKVEVHMFVDASQVAFAAVGYLRALHEGNVDVSFVMGEPRTAPTKLMSIPRLELQSAVLGTRLFKLFQESHELTIERAVFWSDSPTVLQWIHSSQRKYKAFVSHSISEILTSTAPKQWRWVPTAQNTADAATRPSCPPIFDINNRWVKGPDFLMYHEQYWPTLTLQPESVVPEEITTEAILLVQPCNSVIHFSIFGSFSKLRRTAAWVLRTASLFRKQPNSEVNPSTSLSVTEIDAAENMICKLVQRECCASEISNLAAERKLSKRSSLYKLSPYVDESGVLRQSGRIDEAAYLPYQARRPILLPPEHAVSALVVKDVHERNHHQNIAVTINAIRQSVSFPLCISTLNMDGLCGKCDKVFARGDPCIVPCSGFFKEALSSCVL